MSDGAEGGRIYVRPRPYESPEVLGQRVLAMLKEAAERGGPDEDGSTDDQVQRP